MRMAGDSLEIRIGAERAQRAGKAFQVGHRHRLVGEGQHLVRQPGLPQLGNLRGAERLAQVDAVHQRTAGGGLYGE